MTGASYKLFWAIVAVGAFVIHLLTVVRAIARPNRTPASRVAWVAVVMCLPVIGVVAYIFLGETSIGRERARRLRDAESGWPDRAGRAPSPAILTATSRTCAARSTASARRRATASCCWATWALRRPSRHATATPRSRG